MRSALDIIGIMACFLALPTLAVLAILSGHEGDPLPMGTIAIAALTGAVFIIAGEEEHYLRVIGWIAIVVVASIVWACLVSLTGSLSGPAMSILIILVSGVLWGRLRRKLRS